MAGNLRGTYQGQIRTLYDVGTATGLTDGQLLERFATRRDEGGELAFAALVERHGPMVLRACRGILRDHHEAMDVFQATFLVLARKGGSLWVRDSLGPWLHRVACRAAGRARSTEARRRAAEMRAAGISEARIGGGGGDREEIVSVIHEEVNRLPERYRALVVLCDLEGRTCEEAARHLGCPVGTVGSRLARGRERLRDRLRRRGLAPRTGLLAASMKGALPREPVPTGLAGSTAEAASRFVSTGAVLQGTAVTLAMEVLRSMAMNRCWKVASLVFALGASTSGVISFAGLNAAADDPRADEDAPKVTRAAGDAFSVIKPGKLSVVVSERGSLESANNKDAYCMIEGEVTIISLLPEGTRVTKGQLVCELDSASLKDRLINQVNSAKAAETALNGARGTREVAEMAVLEFEQGTAVKEMLATKGEISQSRSAISKAEERLKRTRTARERLETLLAGQGGSKTPADVMAMLDIDDRVDAALEGLGREKKALQVAESSKEVFEKYTFPKTLKQLKLEVEHARSIEFTKRSAWQLEKSKVDHLNKQITYTKILAPADGTVVYANDPNRFGGASRPQIEEGAIVRERQKILSIPDFSKMRVNTKVHESIVDQLKTGMKATIEVDAFPGETLTGVVEDIAPLPDPSRFFDEANVKVYTTHVSIERSLPSLRPGMTAYVVIDVAELDDVLSVPVQAVVWYDNMDHLAVKTPDGAIEWRAVVLGMTNGKVVEIGGGLKAGESVAFDPTSLMSSEFKQKVANSPPRASAQQKKAAIRRKAPGKMASLPAALRTKLMAIAPEERVKMKDASPEEREAILKKGGLTDEEIRLIYPAAEKASPPAERKETR